MTERRNQVSGLCINSECLNEMQRQCWPRYLRITADRFYVQRREENDGWIRAAQRKHESKKVNLPQHVGKQHGANTVKTEQNSHSMLGNILVKAQYSKDLQDCAAKGHHLDGCHEVQYVLCNE